MLVADCYPVPASLVCFLCALRMIVDVGGKPMLSFNELA